MRVYVRMGLTGPRTPAGPTDTYTWYRLNATLISTTYEYASYVHVCAINGEEEKGELTGATRGRKTVRGCRCALLLARKLAMGPRCIHSPSRAGRTGGAGMGRRAAPAPTAAVLTLVGGFCNDDSSNAETKHDFPSPGRMLICARTPFLVEYCRRPCERGPSS